MSCIAPHSLWKSAIRFWEKQVEKPENSAEQILMEKISL